MKQKKIKTIEGQLIVRGKEFAVIASRFNDFITKRLLEACLAELKHRGVKEKEITVTWVSGSFEIPVTALKFARKKNIDAVICLGAVIRGETLHFELVANAASQGIAQVSLLTGKPVIFGVLTTDTIDQAYKRSEIKGENKGRDVATTAIEMVSVMNQI
ncbi:MAG: 6,7-dimethyl-8-ribityllumazine synthase [Candidatus Omnitrophota bacterium]